MYLFVQNGDSLSGVMAQYPAVFPAYYVNMVKTGEVGGQLDKVLQRLADHLEKEHETRGKIRSSLAYPAFVLGVGILTVFVLLTFVIPRLSVMFEDLDQALPLPTLILMHLSGFFARYWWLLLGILVIIKIYWDQWTRSIQGRLWCDGFLLKIPLLGEFVRDAEIGRFARTLGTLLESGVPLTTALNAIHPTIGNLILRDEIKKVSKAVTEGQALKSALGQCSFSPRWSLIWSVSGKNPAAGKRSVQDRRDVGAPDGSDSEDHDVAFGAGCLDGHCVFGRVCGHRDVIADIPNESVDTMKVRSKKREVRSPRIKGG